MTKHLVAAAAAVALCFVAGADKAEARGFHLQAGGVHIDVGSPHSYGYGRRVVGYGGYGAYGGGYRGGWGGHDHHRGGRWHDTTHYDWHAPSVQRHGNHFHFTPSRG